jgi:hypothetical protein
VLAPDETARRGTLLQGDTDVFAHSARTAPRACVVSHVAGVKVAPRSDFGEQTSREVPCQMFQLQSA